MSEEVNRLKQSPLPIILKIKYTVEMLAKRLYLNMMLLSRENASINLKAIPGQKFLSF